MVRLSMNMFRSDSTWKERWNFTCKIAGGEDRTFFIAGCKLSPRPKAKRVRHPKRVDTDLARAEFLGQDAGNSVDRSFGGGVDGGIRGSDGADAGTDVDDASAFGADEFDDFLGGQQQAQHVEIEMFVEVLFGDLVERL